MKRILSLVVWILALGSMMAPPAHAVVVVNAGFEDPPLAPGQQTVVVPPGWTASGPPGSDTGVGEYNPLGVGYYTVPVPEGSNLAYVYDGTPTAGFGPFGVAQVLSATLQPVTEYTLRVAIGDPLSAGGFNFAAFPGYQVQLFAGGALLAQDNNSLAGTFPEGQFGESVVSFTTGSSHANLGQALEIRLINLNPSSLATESEVDFDNVRLTATIIPEPTALTLFGIAALAISRRPSRRSA